MKLTRLESESPSIGSLRLRVEIRTVGDAAYTRLNARYQFTVKPMTDARETRTKNQHEKLARNRTHSI